MTTPTGRPLSATTTAFVPPVSAETISSTDASASVDEVFGDLTGGGAAVVVAQEGRPRGVLTRSDLLEYLAHRR